MDNPHGKLSNHQWSALNAYPRARHNNGMQRTRASATSLMNVERALAADAWR